MNISRDITLTCSNRQIILRPPLMKDAKSIFDAVQISIAELMPWMDWCRPDYSIDVTREWLEQQPQSWEEGSNYQFAIFDKRNHKFLGACGLNHINRYFLFANLGYWIRSDRIGEGIATDATKQVAEFGFHQLGLRRIEIVTGVENWASRRVAEKSGAIFEGILRKRLKLGDDNIDAAMHSLILGDLEK